MEKDVKNLEELDRDSEMRGTLSLAHGSTENSWDVHYTSDVEFVGFQFEVEGGTVLDASLGDIDGVDGFNVSHGNNIIIGYSILSILLLLT